MARQSEGTVAELASQYTPPTASSTGEEGRRRSTLPPLYADPISEALHRRLPAPTCRFISLLMTIIGIEELSMNISVQLSTRVWAALQRSCAAGMTLVTDSPSSTEWAR